MRYLFVLIMACCLLAQSCTYDYSRQFTQQWAGRLYVAEFFEVQRNGRDVLPRDAFLYVPYVLSEVGPAGDVDKIHYLCHGLEARFPRTDCALRPESLKKSLQSAVDVRADYLLWTEIRQLDEKANIIDVDSLVVYAYLYRVRDGSLFDVFKLEARSGLIWDCSDKPVDLLKMAYEDLAKALSTDRIL